MPRCIYCLAQTSGRESRAHAIPEAIAKNDFVLPAGSVCDPCNRYLSTLDTAIVLHRQVWLAIQVLGLPGKTGKARRELGWMKRRDPARPRSVTIEGKGRNALTVDGNRITIDTAEAPGWNLKRFRRSLHYVGLNYVAGWESPEAALHSRFDAVRKYVRKPTDREAWEYVEFKRSPKLIASVDIERRPDAPGEVLAVGLFQCLFFVDLLGGSEFLGWAATTIPGGKSV